VTLAGLDQPDVRALVGQFEATLVTLAAAFVLWRIALLIIDRFYARRFVSRFMPRVATFCTLSKSIVGLVIIVVGMLELLNVWAVDVVPAVWSAGIVTAALAFGSQTVVRDIVTGFFFLFEDQYDVGDRVELVTTTGQLVVGRVDTMELRTTKVVDRQGRFVIVPNGNIALVTNASRLPSKIGFTVAVPWRGDVLAMRARILSDVRGIGDAAGKHDAQFAVSLVDSSADAATFSVEIRSANAEADLEQMHLRESLIAKLQADGCFFGDAPTNPQAPDNEGTH
jgi:small-conductance mechanosensitive channel